ncbi:signal peptide peptidase SppA, 67K type, partial [human gut metagenome]
MNFIKTFLAALLAFVLGSLAILLFGMFILFAIAGSMERTVTVKEGSILRIDFSEVINDAPSSDPLAGFDFRTLQSTRQLSLLKVLRTLEAAAADDRIEGIYLRMNGMGGVTGTALIEELREAIELFKQSGKFV